MHFYMAICHALIFVQSLLPLAFWALIFSHCSTAGCASCYKFRLSGTYCSSIFHELKILDIFQINTLDIAKFMFCYHNNLLPPLFVNLFMTNSQVHTYDTRTAGNYRRHSCRTNIKKFTILYQGPRIWNCLPASISKLSSFPTFKNKVLEFLFKQVLSSEFLLHSFAALISFKL